MSKILGVIGMLFLCASCSKEVLKDQPALGYSMMPGYLNVEAVLPTVSSDSIINPKLPDFQSMTVDSGRIATKNGILISTKKAAMYVFYDANYKMLLTKIGILDTLNKTYYDKALDAEKVYQAQISLLQKDVKRSWLEKNIVYFGFISGVITSILTEYAVLHVK
jgi:hypothetical protein